MSNFIADYTGTGITNLGFPAMKFADCTTVQKDALINNQVSFSVSMQSFSPNLDGYSIDGYTGIIVDGKMGVSIDYATGLLTLNFSNLYQDQVLQTLSTKVQVNVFLKKGGFNNEALFVNSEQVQNMLSLIGSFSAANEGPANAIPASGINYAPAILNNWVSPAPTTVQGALDRIADLLLALNGGNPIP
jgi:hypothetical protein